MSKTHTKPEPTRSSNLGFLAIVGALVAGGLLLVLFAATGVAPDDTNAQTSTVELSGTPLVQMPPNTPVTDLNTDPVAGLIAPTIQGTDFDDASISIADDGRPKVIYFLAHWCPHCQAEVPVIQDLLTTGALPDGVDIYAVSTGVNPGQDNYPPQAWLTEEGFEPITVRDSEQGEAFTAFGGSGFPYAVYLDSGHRVIARSAGTLEADQIAQLWEMAAASG